MIAASEANDGQQRKAVVGRRLAKLDSQTRVEMFPHALVAHDPAAHAVADQDDVASDGLAENEVVKRGHAIYVRRGHAEMSGDITNAFVRNPAPVPLHDL